MQVVADPPKLPYGVITQKVTKAIEMDAIVSVSGRNEAKIHSRDAAQRKAEAFHKTLEMGEE